MDELSKKKCKENINVKEVTKEVALQIVSQQLWSSFNDLPDVLKTDFFRKKYQKK